MTWVGLPPFCGQRWQRRRQLDRQIGEGRIRVHLALEQHHGHALAGQRRVFRGAEPVSSLEQAASPSNAARAKRPRPITRPPRRPSCAGAGAGSSAAWDAGGSPASLRAAPPPADRRGTRALGGAPAEMGRRQRIREQIIERLPGSGGVAILHLRQRAQLERAVTPRIVDPASGSSCASNAFGCALAKSRCAASSSPSER